MKQRLGIAAALLKDPSLLVLDEPANGLDPAGIVEVRELIRSLGAEGRTVFVSSHILSEVQQTADRVAILARGRSVKEGLVSEVLEAGGARGMIVRVSERDAALLALADAGFTAAPAGDVLKVEADPADGERITRILAERGLYLSELRPDTVDLETVFLELTKDAGLES
jgi:ABC-2 type transport system ATP-binding protein